MVSTAFELLVLFALQNNIFDGRGINAIRSKIQTGFSRISEDLEFIMVTKND